jgi:hypothetical protein
MQLTIIYIARVSLHYEEQPTTILQWTRERYAKELAEQPKHSDWWLKRVTEAEAHKIMITESRKETRKKYSEAIQRKYNVGPNWEQDRYFVEQVRPTI